MVIWPSASHLRVYGFMVYGLMVLRFMVLGLGFLFDVPRFMVWGLTGLWS